MKLQDSEIERIFQDYDRDGYARVGRIAGEETLRELRDRIDAIMLGEVTYPELFFQRDADSGSYDDLTYGKGWEGPTLRYRKVEKLERDPLFLSWIENPIFEAIAKRAYNGDPIAIYRALVFNKAAATGGSDLPFHQDGGTFWGLDREPKLQIWTALDDAPLDGGCLEFVPGSHKKGLATPLGGVVPKNKLEEADAEAHIVREPAVAGEVMLVHNHVWHRSGRSTTGLPRRALTVCFLSGHTKCLRKKRAPRVFFPVFQPR